MNQHLYIYIYQLLYEKTIYINGMIKHFLFLRNGIH